jgi:hypothetical protein
VIERKSLLTSYLGDVGIKISGNGGADFPRTYLVISHAPISGCCSSLNRKFGDILGCFLLEKREVVKLRA